MRIDAVTTCVGAEYAGYLAKSLPIWLDTLDSLTVIIGMDLMPFPLPKHGDLTQIPSSVFTADGALFNKGRALNRAIEVANPTDWILAFDCDIIPPKYWRDLAELEVEPMCLHGARRTDEAGKPVDRVWYPRGYFQLWHVSDPRRSPVFNDTFPDAGGYDTEFADQWPRSEWRELSFPLIHQGPKCTNWCGPQTTKQQMKNALVNARQRQRARTGR